VNDNLETEFCLQDAERQSRCRFDVEGAMHRLIREVMQMGWRESEVTMMLADVSEEQVLKLASRMTRPILKLA
jgi:hypothetical protein